MDQCPGADRDCVRRVSRARPAEHEEASGVLLCEPPGLLRARGFHLYADRRRWRRLPDAESRHLDWRTLHALGHVVRAPTHLRNQTVWRASDADAGILDAVPDDYALLSGPAAAERFRRRVPHPERRVQRLEVVRNHWHDRSDLERGLPAVAL